MSKDSIIIKDHKIKDQLLQVMIDNEGSDMYVTVWTHPWIKIGWEILRIDEWIEIFTPEDTQNFANLLLQKSNMKD